jgi:hypothetical protein
MTPDERRLSAYPALHHLLHTHWSALAAGSFYVGHLLSDERVLSVEDSVTLVLCGTWLCTRIWLAAVIAT